MPKIEDTIDVQVPVQQAYNQWTQFEDFPKFMEGIQSVQQLDDTHVQWVAEIRGESRQWTTEITEQRPDEKIAWKTIEGEVKNDGVVTFEPMGDAQTRVNVQMDVESDSTAENVAGDLLGVVKSQVRGDLERFKQLIENRGEETGAWRGEVQETKQGAIRCAPASSHWGPAAALARKALSEGGLVDACTCDRSCNCRDRVRGERWPCFLLATAVHSTRPVLSRPRPPATAELIPARPVVAVISMFLPRVFRGSGHSGSASWLTDTGVDFPPSRKQL